MPRNGNNLANHVTQRQQRRNRWDWSRRAARQWVERGERRHDARSALQQSCLNLADRLTEHT